MHISIEDELVPFSMLLNFRRRRRCFGFLLPAAVTAGDFDAGHRRIENISLCEEILATKTLATRLLFDGSEARLISSGNRPPKLGSINENGDFWI